MTTSSNRITIRKWLQQWPKVELHRHLEGSVRFETAWELAQENPELAGWSPEQLRQAIEFDGERNFAHFLSKFETLRKLYTRPEHIQRVAAEAIEDAARDNIRYMELRFSPDHFATTSGLDRDQIADWILDSANESARLHGITVRFLLTIGRGYAPEITTRILAIALRTREKGVVGVDLAGDEIRFPAEPFAPLFTRAYDEGLGITIHAGEAGPASSVAQAVVALHAHRIGHGIRSIENPNVVALLKQREVALEVCPTSNIQTGVVNSFATHPLPALLEAGLAVVICSDDPNISRITLTDEYTTALVDMGVAPETLAQCVMNGIEHAFLSPAEKKPLREQLAAELGHVLLNSPLSRPE